MNDDNYIYECIVEAKCVTNKELDFEKTFGVCTTRKKAGLLAKAYLSKEWFNCGYECTSDSFKPYQPGHKYFIQSKYEKWILIIYIMWRHLDELWIDDEVTV